MKVAILCFGTSGKGGMETVISHVIKELNNRGIHTKLFLLGGSNDEKWLEDLPVNKLGEVTDRKIFRYLKYALILPKRLLKFKPDIIIGADERAVYLGCFFRRCLKLKARVGSWIHFNLGNTSYHLMKKADFHLAINKENFKQYYNLKINMDNNVYLSFNPVVVKNMLIPYSENRSHFVYIGRLEFEGDKRVRDLINAFSLVKGDWELTIIGDGEDKVKLQLLAKELGINENINWLGWKSNPWEWIQDATALVLTSDFEGFGMVLVEAMSYGIPCISSNCPTGPTDIIQPNKNGWFYTPRQVEELTEIIEMIIKDPNCLYNQMDIKDSIKQFESNYVIENLVKLLNDIDNKKLIL